MPPKKKSAFGNMVKDFATGKSAASSSLPVSTQPEGSHPQPQLVIQAPPKTGLPVDPPLVDPSQSEEVPPLQIKRRRLTKAAISGKGNEDCQEVNPDWVPQFKFPDGRSVKYSDSAAIPDTAIILLKGTMLPRDKRRLQELNNGELAASAISHSIQVSHFPHKPFSFTVT